ncbi:MAG: DUF11 domain-containing protein, partial [Phycisphaerales bacterium]|nr:DUF11 domain-containing protein [Phycisphaerales bacterium]
MLNRLLLAAACVGALGLAGCSSSTTRSSSSGGDTSALEARLNKAIEDAERAAEEARRAARSGGGGSSYSYSPDVGNGMEVHSMAFPTGDPATSPIQVDQVTPSQANRGAPYEVHYHVTNVSSSTLQNVSVIAGEFQNYDIDGFAPAPQETADGYMWYIGDLASQETKVLRVRGTSHELRNMSSCVSVAYANSLCASTPIVEAGLELVKSAPDMSILCDSITLSYRVCNPGTGTARNVVVRDELPAGMALVSGGRVVNREVGDLGPGDCFDFAVDVKV